MPAAVAFAIVLLARLWLVDAYGSPVPFWDQWGADALQLYRPWLNGSLDWHALLAPHNEHRPALTRLASLALFIANGQVWPVWQQLWLNAFLHASCAGLLVAVFTRTSALLPSGARTALAVGVAFVFASPAGWQNALWGFQSQVYFASLLSVTALAGLLLAAPLRPIWWLGWLAAILALFTQGSGPFAAAIALLVTAVTWFFTRETIDRRRHLLTLFAIASVLALSLVLQVSQPAHASLAAQNPAQFWAVFSRCIGWPWVDSPWAWLALQAPLAGLAWRQLRGGRHLEAVDRLALALGLLTVLHAAAVAFTRAGGLVDARPLSRYQDPLFIGVAAQLYATLRLASLGMRGARAGALVWSGVMAAGLLALSTTNFSLNLPFKRLQNTTSLTAIRAYLVHGDPAVLVIEPALLAPHPDPAVIRAVLDDPRLRAILPTEFFIEPEFNAPTPPRTD